jgi:hypothetical protein
VAIPPTLPQPSDVPAATNLKKKTLAAAMELYLSDTPMRAATARDVRKIAKHFTEVVGPERMIDAIDEDDIRAFREIAKRVPSRPTRVQQSMSFKNLSEAHKDAPASTKLSQRTLNKWFDLLSALFEHAQKHRYIVYNPVRSLKISKKKHQRR